MMLDRRKFLKAASAAFAVACVDLPAALAPKVEFSQWKEFAVIDDREFWVEVRWIRHRLSEPFARFEYSQKFERGDLPRHYFASGPRTKPRDRWNFAEKLLQDVRVERDEAWSDFLKGAA
jgi:hypothetical protein